MTKLEIAAKITAALIAIDTATKEHRISAVERMQKVNEVYRRYNPDTNVWRKACKDAALHTNGYWLP